MRQPLTAIIIMSSSVNHINLKQLPTKKVIARHVAKFYGDVMVSGLEWEVRVLQFHSYAASTQQILDVSGSALRQGRKHQWRLLVKCLRKPPDPQSAAGWDREILAYECLLSQNLTVASIRVPKFLGAERTSPQTARLWLEYIEGKPAAEWSLTNWRELASALASLQAGFVGDGRFLSEDWLNRNDLRGWVEGDRVRLFSDHVFDAQGIGVAPLVCRDTYSAVMKIWRRRRSILKRLDELPKTVCHNDVWAGNVLYDACSRPVARRPVLLDWQLVGPGPVGSDPPFAVVASAWLMLLPFSGIRKFEHALLSGYLAGLRRAGRADLTAYARVGFALTAAMRYTLMLPQLLADISDRSRLDEICRQTGFDPDQVLRQRAFLIHRGLHWASAAGFI